MQSLMENQDQTLSLISGTLNTLHGQASLMGREVGEQNGCVPPPPLYFLLRLSNPYSSFVLLFLSLFLHRT